MQGEEVDVWLEVAKSIGQVAWHTDGIWHMGMDALEFSAHLIRLGSPMILKAQATPVYEHDLSTGARTNPTQIFVWPLDRYLAFP